MEKEKIEIRDKIYREKLNEMRKKLSERHVRADRRKRSLRNNLKVALPLLLVFVLAAYFWGKMTRSHQPVSTSVPDKIQTVESRPPVKPARTESGAIVAGSGKNRDNLSDETDVEASGAKIELVAPEGEQERPLSHEDMAKILESENEPPLKNRKSGPALSAVEVSGKIPDASVGGNADFRKTDETKSVPPPSSASSISLYGTRIARQHVCSGVEALECVAPKSIFGLNQRKNPHFWMEVISDSVPYVLKHVYYHEGRKFAEVPLKIKYRRMRTWSYITLTGSASLGSWRVAIEDEGGNVLGRAEFEVTAER